VKGKKKGTGFASRRGNTVTVMRFFAIVCIMSVACCLTGCSLPEVADVDDLSTPATAPNPMDMEYAGEPHYDPNDFETEPMENQPTAPLRPIT